MPVDMSATEATAVRRFFVVWQDPETRELIRVGELSVSDSEQARTYSFAYTSDAAAAPRFHPFPAFPSVARTYESSDLFPFFQNRVMSPRRPDFPEYLSALGLGTGHADPVELLARTGGERATDTIQVVPSPVRDGEVEVLRFLVSGVRHVDPSGERLAGLHPGVRLEVRPEPDNDFDPRALLLDVESGHPVGYVPSYLLDFVHKRREQHSDIAVTVEQVNGPEVPWHLRLLCRMDITVAD